MMTRVNDLLVAASAGAMLALSGAAASAQGLFDNPALYIKGFGGATFQQDTDVDLYFGGSRIASGDIDFDTGYTVGAALGVTVAPNIAVELEYAYRRSDVSSLEIGGVEGDGGTSRADALMLNALYTLDGMGATGQWRPYFGGGVGTANVRIGPSGESISRDWIWAYQLIGGVAYDETPQLSLNGEVRWFGTEGGRFDTGGGSSLKADWNTVDLLVGATYRF
jgi:opacity protein-like surface antigen